MAIFKKRMARIMCAAAVVAAVTVAAPAAAGVLSDKVDRLEGSLDDIESKVQSTLVSGGSSPVSFAGEARLKVQYHNLGFDAPGYMTGDRSYLQSGWEGNENIYRLGMVVHPGRNLVLWSKIGFQHTLTGQPTNTVPPTEDGFVEYPYRQDKVRNSITIHEDMCAGIAVRTVPASFWVKMGNTLWTEASPLTVWKSQPRTFAWEYLPFEVEQPISRYYEYNIAKGAKDGRAAWNKKPFNGINVESINLPWELYANFVYGTFERYDNFEREFIDFANDLGYADGEDENMLPPEGGFPAKGHGIGDSYRHVIHGRLAKGKTFGDMTLGLNYVGIDYKEQDALFAWKGGSNNAYLFLREFKGSDSVFFKEPKTVSVDLRGPIAGPFSIHADLALNWTDTVWMIDTVSSGHTPGDRRNHPEYYNTRAVSDAELVSAFYSKLTYEDKFKLDADLAWISPGFYSPFSFAAPEDAFYAFGTNMLGAGKFIARGEGSPYTQNMAGVNLTYTPKLPGYGHLRLKYGQHWNITEDGRDLLFFPHRLNGSDAFSFFHSSFNRWGNGLIDNSVKTSPNGSGQNYYKGRLGDESAFITTSWNVNANILRVAGPDAGGLRTDYMSMLEGFVPYNSAEEAYRNWRAGRTNDNGSTASTLPTDTNVLKNYSTITNRSHVGYHYDTVWVDGDIARIDTTVLTTNTSWVPTSKKYTFNLELDAAYDIGKAVGYKRDLFVGGYAGISGITRSDITALTFNEKDPNTLLWSFYTRLEPAIALHKNFYVLGLFGFENWRSDKSWMMVYVDAAKVSKSNPNGVTGIRNPTKAANLAPPNGDDTPVTVKNFVQVPIDFRDFAYGIGFDWDVLERVGLHGRFKVIQHIDQGLNDKYKEWGIDAKPADKNDWITPVVSLEVKTWF